MASSTVVPESRFRCPECLAVMPSCAAIVSHCQRMHRDVYTVARCCGELFFSRGSYHKHCSLRHPNAFVCSQCKTAFPSGAQLKLHQLAYVKTYTCPMCGQREGKLSKLMGHVEIAHSVILDQRYVLVDIRPRSATEENRLEKRRSVMRKIFDLTVPCCRTNQEASTVLETFFASGRFERSYTCGFGSEDAYREPFVEPDGNAIDSDPAVAETREEEDTAARTSMEETGESAISFFDGSAGDERRSRPTTPEPVFALKRFLDSVLAMTANAADRS